MERRSSESPRLARRSTRSFNDRNPDVDEGGTSSYELQNARFRSVSVDEGGNTNSTEDTAADIQRQPSLALPTQRRPLSTILRRSTGSRDGRPPSCSKPRNNTVPEPSPGPSSTPRFSRTSSFGPVRAESPYQGASGPMHPYAMYSQDTNMSRTASVATTSTVRRPERSYTGPTGPTQPYGMYAQNTVSEEDSQPFAGASNSIGVSYPAGSRPAPQHHHRRIGPDGEDLDDLIGPDGYAEQLPPYTRYPNDIPPKRDPDASSFVNGPAPSSIPPPNPSPSGLALNHDSGPLPTHTAQDNPINITTQAPPAAENLSNLRQPFEGPTTPQEPVVQSPRSNPFSDTSTQDSSNAVNENGKPDSEDGNISFSKRAQRPLKKRICWGLMPCWLLLVLILTCLAIMIGGIIGGVLAHDQGVKAGAQHALAGPSSTQSSVSTSVVTSIIPAQTPDEAAPVISIPTPLPTLPTGPFSVTLDEPYATTNTCIASQDQNNAWDCSTGASLSITIGMQQTEPYVTLKFPQRIGGNKIQYGAQPPQLPGASSLLFMRDKSRKALDSGPAYTFQQTVDKVVIVRAQDFPGAIAKRGWRQTIRRWLGRERLEIDVSTLLEARDQGNRQSDWNMTNYASPTDKPWKCVWGGTLLSGFIYVEQNVDEQAQYPKAMKLVEKRPKKNRQKATCQQMTIAPNFELIPLKMDDGSFHIVPINEVAPVTYDEDNDYDEAASSSSRIRRRADGTRCECVWQST